MGSESTAEGERADPGVLPPALLEDLQADLEEALEVGVTPRAQVRGALNEVERALEEHGRTTGLCCPFPSCRERVHDHHDESAISALVYHLSKEHPRTLAALKDKLGAP